MSTVEREPEQVPINVGIQAKRIKQQVKIDGAVFWTSIVQKIWT